MDLKHLILRLKYPTLAVLILMIVLSVIVSSFSLFVDNAKLLGGNNYLNFFVAGFLTPLGVLTPFAAAFFINTKFENIIFSVFLAGFGAVICDSIIFSLLKKFFASKGRSKEVPLIKLKGFFSDNKVGRKLVNYVSFALAGWIIAAPLPDGIGEKLVSILSKMNTLELLVLSFIVNTGMIASFVIMGLLF
jgi:hypothetical protein